MDKVWVAVLSCYGDGMQEFIQVRVFKTEELALVYQKEYERPSGCLWVEISHMDIIEEKT